MKKKQKIVKEILKQVKHPVLLVLLLFIFACMQPMFSWGVSKCIDSLNSDFAFFMGATVTIAAIGLFTEAMGTRLLISEGRNIELFMQKLLMDNFCRMQPGKLEDNIKGGYFMKFYRDCVVISSAFKVLLPFLIVSITNLIVIILIVTFKQSILLFGIMMIPFAICAFLLFPYKRKIANANCEMMNSQDRTAENLLHFFTIFANMKVNAVEQNFSNKTKQIFCDQNEFTKRVDLLDFHFEFNLKLIVVISKCALLIYTGIMVSNGSISVGDLVLYQLLLVHIGDTFSRSMSLVQFIGTYGEAIHSFEYGISNDHMEEITDSLPQVQLSGEINAKSISFSYDSRKIIDEFSIEIKPNKFVVIEGDNGSGKSTLLKLLSTFHSPDFGSICYNGIDIKTVNLPFLRKQIFYISQHQTAADVVLLENITLGNLYTENQIEEAMTEAGLNEFHATEKAHGWDIRHRQSQYSGGELQRIAIAQASLRSPKILFIDELENHLDSEGCNIYANWLKKQKGTSTIIVVSHKQEIIDLADQIIHLKAGSFAIYDSAKGGIYHHNNAEKSSGGLL